MAFISSFSEAPSGRLSRPRTLAALLPSRVPAAGDEAFRIPGHVDLGCPNLTRAKSFGLSSDETVTVYTWIMHKISVSSAARLC